MVRNVVIPAMLSVRNVMVVESKPSNFFSISLGLFLINAFVASVATKAIIDRLFYIISIISLI